MLAPIHLPPVRCGVLKVHPPMIGLSMGRQGAKGRYRLGAAIPASESGRSVSKSEPTTDLESTVDAVNRKASVAFGRGCDGRLPILGRQVVGRSGLSGGQL